MKRFFLLLLLLLLFSLPALGDEMTLQAPESLQPLADSAFTVTVPADGVLSVWVKDGYMEDFFLLQNEKVQAGEITVPFDGCIANGECLPRGAYTVNAAFMKENGQGNVATASFFVKYPLADFLYVLPAQDTLYLNQAKFQVDFLPTRDCVIYVYAYNAAGEKVRSWSLEREANAISRFQWDGTANEKNVMAGEYTLTFQVKGGKGTPVTVPVTVTDAQMPDTAVTKTDSLLPEKAADVWAKITAPAVVADVGITAVQKMYQNPDATSNVVGMLHGQTQAVEVMAFTDNGFAWVGAWRQEDGTYVTGYVPVQMLKTVYPQTEYGILVNKGTQTITVYKNGEILGSLACSTGVGPVTDTQDMTRSGAFLVGERAYSFRSKGYWYMYCLRYDGGNLLHQVGCTYEDGTKHDFSVQTLQLGQAVSAGCVRMDWRQNEDGLNAYWLFTHIPNNTKVLVVDSLADDLLVKEDMVEAPLTGATADILITMTGDCVLGSADKDRAKENSFDSLIGQNGFTWPFRNVAEFFSTDDVTMINLECALKDDSNGKVEKLYNFRGPTAFAAIMPENNIELCNIANNHFIDYGAAGRASTRNALETADVRYSGYQSLFVYEKDGVKVGFTGIRETTYKQDKSLMENDIRALQIMGCDLIVYACHFGNEYERTHNELQTEMAHRAIDLGANLVVGAHPHVVQGVESYNGGVILYSLGNFSFGGNLELTEFDGLMAQVCFHVQNGRYTGLTLSLYPVLTTGTMPDNDFSPRLATGEDYDRIWQKIQTDSTGTISPVMTFETE